MRGNREILGSGRDIKDRLSSKSIPNVEVDVQRPGGGCEGDVDMDIGGEGGKAQAQAYGNEPVAVAKSKGEGTMAKGMRAAERSQYGHQYI